MVMRFKRLSRRAMIKVGAVAASLAALTGGAGCADDTDDDDDDDYGYGFYGYGRYGAALRRRTRRWLARFGSRHSEDLGHG